MGSASLVTARGSVWVPAGLEWRPWWKGSGQKVTSYVSVSSFGGGINSPASARSAESLAKDNGNKKAAFRILIADDHEAVRRGLRAALAGAGWKIVGEAVDGRDAIEKNKELSPDLVILDISMPNVGGLEAAREIIKSSKQTKILVFTMHESKQIREETAAIGVHALAVKSAPLSTLLATIDSLFRESQ